MKSFLVIGMGSFGRHLAEKMIELGDSVVVVDKNQSLIEEIADRFPDSYYGDCTNPAVLGNLGVNNFDVCFVAIGEDFFSSLEITSILKELGARYVVSKAKGERQSKFLRTIGADEVIYPEKEIAERLAVRFNADNIFDNYQLTDEYSIYEIPVLSKWINKAIETLDVRNKYNVNIIAIKNENSLNPNPSPKYVFKEGDHIIVIGSSKNVFTLAGKK
ncbi:MAG TPA: TrkA family potassium uptake protein [Flexilinea sp.]|nr:TrkA family potassium uptake protein [Flexilinea sp.]